MENININNIDKQLNKLEQLDENEFIKHNALMLSNIAQSINKKQALLLTYAIKNIKMEGRTPLSRFKLTDFLRDCKLNSKNYTNTNIQSDVNSLMDIKIKSADENFLLNKEIGLGKYDVTNPIYRFKYSYGDFTCEWASNLDNVKMLQDVTKEVSKYNFDLLVSLSDNSWSLYEIFVALKQRGIYSLEMTNAEIGLFFKAEGKNSAKYAYLKRMYLIPALQEINEHKTDIHVELFPIKESRRITGVKLIFDNRLLPNEATASQITMAQKLLVFFTQYNDSYKYDKDYQNIRESLLKYETTSAQDLYNVNRVAREIQTRVKKELGLINNSFTEYEECRPFLKNYEGTTPNRKECIDFLEYISKFKIEEIQSIVDLAIKIFVSKKKDRLSYVNTVLQGWIDKEITTYEEALYDFENHYGGFISEEAENVPDLTPELLEAFEAFGKSKNT